MQQFATIFVLNLLTSIDNAIVMGGIANKTRHDLLRIGLVSSVLLTGLRTALIMGVVSVSGIPGFRFSVSVVVLWVAFRLAQVPPKADERKDPSFWRLILMIVATDTALSIDNILSLSVVTKNSWLIGFGVLFSLVPLLLLLPLFVNVMDKFPWIQLLAAGFVAELAVDGMTDDQWLGTKVPTGKTEFFIRIAAAGVVVLYGLWQLWRAKRTLS